MQVVAELGAVVHEAAEQEQSFEINEHNAII